ncbi:Adhesion G protein-coupled receptor L2 [Trichoplax sp. H2]|nr:Adhesion G protein-coupled receptor L2 [Trichoplax sp. H2]|eukprot:RDD36709.1 Adhesion G protein-coupled receptor L2 [Trichoplax sp. H2]
MMVNDATSKLGGRKAVCCQDGSSNTNSCPPGYEASPCKSIQEDSVIWPSTPSGGVAKLSKCKTTFSPHPVVGNLTRTCKKDSDGIFSNWENVDRCACQSIHINSIQERLSRKFAKNYTLAYLNQLASFLYEKWDVVPNRPRPISVLGQIFNIQKRRQLSDATYAAYMNVTACLLNTANALIINTLNGNSECRIDEVQRRHLRILFYQLASNLKSPSFVNQRLGSQEEFTNVNYDTSSVYNEIIQNINYNCVVVGAVVPPAFLNDTILYNVLGIDVIGIGSNTAAPTENITYIGNNTNITNTSFPPSQPIDVHAPILSIITIVGLSFSTVCLVLLVACLIFLRLPRTRKWYIHGNLIAAVISSNVIFLFGADRRYVANNVACTAIAVILHYLFTAVFTWQLAEGVHLYRLLVTIFIKSGRLWIVIYTVIGWIVPAVIVGITAGVAPHAYGGVDACFLTSNFIWFFLGPMAFVVTINVVIFCILIYIIHKKSNFTNKVSNQELNKRQVLKNDLRRAFALLPLLGICWIFIFFVQLRHPIPRYLFTILLSFQGVFVFVFHCIFDQQIMEALRNRNFRFCGSSKRYTSSNSAKKNINSPSLGRSRGVQHPENITSRSSSYTDLHSISQSNNYTITKNGKS